MKTLSLASVIIGLLVGTASAQILVDSFGPELFHGIQHRMMNLRVEMGKHPGSKAYIVVHKPKGKMTLGWYMRRLHGMEYRWVEDNRWMKDKYPAADLKVLPGPESDEILTEMWLVREGEQFSPKVISLEEKLTEKVSERTLFDEDCIACEPSVFIDQSSLHDGLDYFGTALRANPTSQALMVIGKAEGKSATCKDRSDLRTRIYEVLTKKYGVPKKMIEIKFVKSDFARFYIIPPRKKR